MYGITTLLEAYTFWLNGEAEKKEKFAVSFSASKPMPSMLFVGLPSIQKYLNKRVFREEEIAYLHSLQKTDGKLLFSDRFIRFISTLTFDIKLEAPLEGVVFFPGQPIFKVSGNKIALSFYKRIIEYYLPRQVGIATETERVASMIAPSYVVFENCSTSYEVESELDTRSAFVGGAVATLDLFASVTYNIPLFYVEEGMNLKVIDVYDKNLGMKISSLSGSNEIFLKGSITTEFIEEFFYPTPSVKGVFLDPSQLRISPLKVCYHYYRNQEVLDSEFQIYRFSHKGLFIGDIVTKNILSLNKKTIFGKFHSSLDKQPLLHNVTEVEGESSGSVKARIIKNMRSLPCKYRGKDALKSYPIRFFKEHQSLVKKESFSNTRLA
jgi:hypothetical protein